MAEDLAGGQRERTACSSSLLQVRPDLHAGVGRPTFQLSGASEGARGLLICSFIQKLSILFFFKCAPVVGQFPFAVSRKEGGAQSLDPASPCSSEPGAVGDLH